MGWSKRDGKGEQKERERERVKDLPKKREKGLNMVEVCRRE